MKKKEFKEGQIVEIFRPFLMAIQFIAAFILIYMCMKQDFLPFGVCSIFFGWQAGWAMRYTKYISEKTKKMKIIEKGKPRQKTCPTCGCIFEYEVTEIEHISGMTCMNRGTDVVYCPQCNERIGEKSGLALNSLGHLK